MIKPDGFPTYLGSPLGIIVYCFDTGTGVYSIPVDSFLNSFTGHAFDPTTYIGGGGPNIYPAGTPNDPDITTSPTGSTTYGTAIKWPGTFLKPGTGALLNGIANTGTFPGNDPLRTAVDLINQPTGTAFTMFATFMQTSNTASGSSPIICGRGSNLDSNFYICMLNVSASGSQLNFNWATDNTGTHSTGISMVGNYSLNTLHTAVATCYNTSFGVTNVDLYLDGILVKSASGTTVSDVSANNSGNEDQFQIGALFHVYAGQSDSGFIGSIYQCGVATKKWSSSDAVNFSANPYQYLTI